MRGMRSTLVLLTVFVVIGGYAYFIESERPPASATPPNEKVFTFEEDDVTEIHVTTGAGEVTELERADDGDAWEITAPIRATADETAVSSIARSLASLEVRRVVEEDASDLTPYGLSEPSVDLAFALDDAADLRRLLIGDTTPTGADRYAKLGDRGRVFLISAALESTFNRGTFALRDKAILDFDRDAVDRFETVAADRTVRLAKEDNDWRLTEPFEARADFSSVEGLIGRLNTGQMGAIEAENTDELEPYGLAEPRLIVTIGAGSAGTTLLIGNEAPAGTVYARDGARPVVFTIDASLATDLDKDTSDYRDKDLFRFRPFNAARLVVERRDERLVFEKSDTPEDSEETEEVWRRIEPGNADVDRSAMDDLLAQLSNLRAESFIDSRDELSEPPFATLEVGFGEGDDVEVDRVVVWRSGEETYAAHADEPGAALIDTRAFDEALEAIETVQADESSP